MTDKLGMSLDQIIQQTSSFDKHSKKKDAPVKAESERHKFSKFQRKIDRTLRTTNHEDQNTRSRVSQPLKVITKGRPRIIRPEDVHLTSAVATTSSQKNVSAISTSSSVFSRLGNSGVHVLFKNLNSSVKKEDITELCRAIGEIRDLNFLNGFDGLGQARVLFANKNAAEQCVKKYNGVTLDGLDMMVTIDSQKQMFSVQPMESNEKSTHSIKNERKTDGNKVRGGLFGTALSDIDNSGAHQKKSTARSVTFVSGKKLNHN